jgi:hypothetical protein
VVWPDCPKVGKTRGAGAEERVEELVEFQTTRWFSGAYGGEAEMVRQCV